ncbi:MAG: Bax inhibitor-1/YccA family protein [Anaeroplasmataceae bacterium]
MVRNGNPMFSSVGVNYDEISENQATYKGVTIKTLFLLGVAGLSGIMSGVGLFRIQNFTAYYTFLCLSLVIGFISVIIGRSSVRYSKYFAVLYAVCEGVLLGTIASLANIYYPGIALLAILVTAGIFLVCLVLFACGALRNISMLRNVMMIIFFDVIFMSLITLICQAFNVPGISSLLSNNLGLAIGLEVVLIIYAAITLALNFNEVTYYVQSGSSKEFEWIGAFGLLVSILYIYLEAVRLLMLLFSRKD